MGYENITDEQLACSAKTDKGKSFEELLKRCSSELNRVVNKYFNKKLYSNTDKEDLMQAGMLALARAVDGYDGKSKFKGYAYTCIENGVLSALREKNSKKNQPLKDYLSLSGCGDDDLDKSPLLMDSKAGPEDFVINNEKNQEIESIIKNELSELEYKIFELHRQGYSYSEIADNLGLSKKSVDNAMQRVKKKLSPKLGV